MRISEGFPGFPLQSSSISLAFLDAYSTSVMSSSFSLIWIPDMETQIGLGFVSILVSVLNSDLEGEQYLSHVEREAHEGSKSESSQHPIAFATS